MGCGHPSVHRAADPGSPPTQEPSPIYGHPTVHQGVDGLWPSCCHAVDPGLPPSLGLLPSSILLTSTLRIPKRKAPLSQPTCFFFPYIFPFSSLSSWIINFLNASFPLQNKFRHRSLGQHFLLCCVCSGWALLAQPNSSTAHKS